MARILIVDDSLVMRKNLSLILKNDGHEVVGEAANGRQGVTMYKDLKPDLVTMDISMPLMSGVEAVAKIIEEDPQAKIVMISAVNQKKMVFNALNSGAKHYVVKPIEPDKVTAVIGAVLSEVKDPESSQIIEESDVQGFNIENIDGAFVIRFNQHLGLKDHSLLEMAIRGIMFIKPLKVVMDFTEYKNYNSKVIGPIIKLAKTIKSVEGQVSFQGENDEIFKCLKEDHNG